VEVKSGGIQTSSVGVGNYSGVSVGALDFKPGTYSGVTFETNNIAQSIRSLIADDFLKRSVAGGAPSTTRSVQNALRTQVNKVVIGSSVGTVYTEDDATSAFTFSITTDSSAVPITGIDPAGP
jgi:hypothetical protein